MSTGLTPDLRPNAYKAALRNTASQAESTADAFTGHGGHPLHRHLVHLESAWTATGGARTLFTFDAEAVSRRIGNALTDHAQSVRSNVGRLVALGCALAVALGACAPKPDPEQPPAASTVGVLLTEDLPGDRWTGPSWDFTGLYEAGEGSRRPAFGCRMPEVATSSIATGLVAHASAAWRLPDDSDTVLRSTASRYRGRDSLAQTLATMDRFAERCATTGTDREVTLRVTENVRVYDELDQDVSSQRWRLRMAWTTLPDDVIVQVAVHWRDGHEPPVDVEDLLSHAVKRADTLPQTSPRPGFPPACEDC